MAHFNYYPTTYTGQAKSFRIVKPSTGEVWAFSGTYAGTLVSDSTAAESYTNTSGELTLAAGAKAYPVTIPAKLPSGEYDLLIYDVDAASASVSDNIERGFAFRWMQRADGTGGHLYAPREFLSDRLF